MREIIKWTEEVTNYPEVAGSVMMYLEESKLEKGKCILSRMEDIEPLHKEFSYLFVYGKIQQITLQLFGDDDKRLSYPPDIERDTNKEYVFRRLI